MTSHPMAKSLASHSSTTCVDDLVRECLISVGVQSTKRTTIGERAQTLSGCKNITETVDRMSWGAFGKSSG